MRIGINRSGASIWSGGIFHYETIMLDALGEIANDSADEFVSMSFRPDDVMWLLFSGHLKYRGIPIQPLYPPPPPPKLESPEFYLRQPPPARPLYDLGTIKFDAAAEGAFRRAGIDLLLLLSPFLQAFSLRLPFVMPIFDLMHRVYPEFPEVSDNGETNHRDYLFMNGCRFATFILVDSEVGKADVLRFYGDHIDEDRIRVLPYYPPILRAAKPSPEDLARVKAKYNLPARYFFYPAQFWRHKNHALIARAMRLIADETGEAVELVLCGSYGEYYRAQAFAEFQALTRELGVAERVRFIGVVPEEDMGALYALSAGLVMPTFFGPTNIPPVEAWHYGRPVITSDIPGMREQIGDAGLLVDPRSAPALAAAMRSLWNDATLGAELAGRGQRRLASYDWRAFVAGVAAIMREASERVRAGRTPRYP